MICSCSAVSPFDGVCASCGASLPPNDLHMHCQAVPQVHFDDFIPYVAARVVRAPDELMGQFIREAAIEFARRTGALRRTAWLRGVPGTYTYDLAFGDCYSIGHITSVEAGGSCLRQIDRLPCGDRCEVEGGLWYQFEMPDRLHVSEAPLAAPEDAFIEVNASVIPGQDSCRVDRLLYDRWAEVIAHGALHRLYGIPGEDWANANMAATYYRMFMEGMARAEVDRLRGYSEDRIRRRKIARGNAGFLP